MFSGGIKRDQWHEMGYWLDIFRKVGIGVFLYSCMFLHYLVWRGDYFFMYVGHAAVAYFNVVFTEQLVKFLLSRIVLVN